MIGLKVTDYGGRAFLTGYTGLDSKSAIIGTSGGFVRQQDSKFVSYSSLKDPSYERLARRIPMLFLGRNGQR